VQGWSEIRAWRKATRAELIACRLAVPAEERARGHDAITAAILQTAPELSRLRVGLYWPFKGEYDSRPLMRMLHAQGARLALPVVVEKAAPLVFREWWPGARMELGVWSIPVPAEGEEVVPQALLVSLVGFDEQGFRLGYGGGYYDRTLAAMPDRPRAIGVGFELTRLATIHPQPHDIPMDVIVTEREAIHRPGTAPPATLWPPPGGETGSART
jgi:5-formyltetrahydrofolate cyclo-ligase